MEISAARRRQKAAGALPASAELTDPTPRRRQRVHHNPRQSAVLLRKSAECVEVDRPIGLHLFDQVDDLFAATTRPDLLSQCSELGQIDRLFAFVQGLLY